MLPSSISRPKVESSGRPVAMGAAEESQSMRSVYMGASIAASVSRQSSHAPLVELLLSRLKGGKKSGGSASDGSMCVWNESTRWWALVLHCARPDGSVVEDAGDRSSEAVLCSAVVLACGEGDGEF